jgi:hypothetical protein
LVEKLSPENLEWFRKRTIENMIIFYYAELEKIHGGVNANSLLTGREMRRLKQTGILQYKRGKPKSVEVSSWALEFLRSSY